MFSFFKDRTLKDHLNQTKKVKVKGILFHIRKISPIHYLDGSQVLISSFDTYNNSKREMSTTELNSHMKKLKVHFKDAIMSGVVKPALTRKPDKEPDKIDIEEVFEDWEMVNDLYQKIMDYSYGKKKLKLRA